MNKVILLNVLEYFCCFRSIHRDCLPELFKYVSTQYRIDMKDVEQAFHDCIAEGKIRYVESEKQYYF